MKDPSKAAHAADADLKELLENRDMEMKKEPFTEAKCDQKRYDQASLNATSTALTALFYHQCYLYCALLPSMLLLP